MGELEKLFSNIDYLAESVSKVNIEIYKNMICSDRISGIAEQAGYFCSVPKMKFTSIGEAFPILFTYSLYAFQEWELDKPPFENFEQSTWRNHLRAYWIPEYLGVGSDTMTVDHEYTTEEQFRKNFITIADSLAQLAIHDPIKQVIRYGSIKAWNMFDYLIETESRYIDFQYWTTA